MASLHRSDPCMNVWADCPTAIVNEPGKETTCRVLTEENIMISFQLRHVLTT